jgi:hypothetical protein
MSANPPHLLATMAVHLPCLPVLLFVFLAVHVPSTHADPPLLSTYDVAMCSESTWCGGVEIRYPFYLANTTEATTDYSGNFSCGCGYTDLNISCKLEGQTWTPTIRLGGGGGDDEYTVKNISYNYNDGTILLVDSDVLLEGGDCPAVRHEVSFDETWLHDISFFNDNLTFFFGCYPHGPVPHEFDAYKINCTQFRKPLGAGPGDSFVVIVTDERGRYVEQELATNCGDSMIVTVPVRAASNQNNFTSGGYGDVLKRGFELEWSRIIEDGCHLCEESNGQCAYSHNKVFLGCLCNGGKVGNPYCKRSSK